VSGKDDRGNGDRCPLDPEHGNMYVLTSGNMYCAHVAHIGHGDVIRTRSIWRPAELHAVTVNPATGKVFDPVEKRS